MQISESFVSVCSCGNNLNEDEQKYCQECVIIINQQLTRQIQSLRSKSKFYSDKLFNLNKIFQSDHKQKLQLKQITNSYQQSLNKQFVNKDQKYIKYLQEQLLSLDLVLDSENQYERFQKQKIIKLSNQYQNLQTAKLLEQKKYLQLSEFYINNLVYKQTELNKMLQFFQKTNFVAIIYSINFENDSSFLNGEKIIPDNAWKLTQLLRFYHRKYYNNYKPEVQICMDSMTLTIPIYLINKINKINKISKQPNKQTEIIEINCDSQSDVLEWLPYIAIEIARIFQFVKKIVFPDSLHKLKYLINENGELQVLKNKFFNDSLGKFNASIKYLLSNLDQINKFQFFAAEKRFQIHQERNKLLEKSTSSINSSKKSF